MRDQDAALKFYTELLGFSKKDDIPEGEYRWLTLVSPDAPEGMELSLEPNAHEAARAFQKPILSCPILEKSAPSSLRA